MKNKECYYCNLSDSKCITHTELNLQEQKLLSLVKKSKGYLFELECIIALDKLDIDTIESFSQAQEKLEECQNKISSMTTNIYLNLKNIT